MPEIDEVMIFMKVLYYVVKVCHCMKGDGTHRKQKVSFLLLMTTEVGGKTQSCKILIVYPIVTVDPYPQQQPEAPAPLRSPSFLSGACSRSAVPPAVPSRACRCGYAGRCESSNGAAALLPVQVPMRCSVQSWER